jgi:hypothetical protein
MNPANESSLSGSPQTGTVRIARPARDLERTTNFYVEDVGWTRHGGFRGHDGFDGDFVGPLGVTWHLEITFHAQGPLPQPTVEDIMVLYLSGHESGGLFERLVTRGHSPFEHPNPYWKSVNAHCFRDPDGYVLILCPTSSAPNSD